MYNYIGVQVLHLRLLQDSKYKGGKHSVMGVSQSRQSTKLFLKSSELGLPHPFGSWGRAHSLGGEGVGDPNSNEGTYTVVLSVFTYFVGRMNA